MRHTHSSCAAAALLALSLLSCNSPVKQPPAADGGDSSTSTVGRWSGSFTGQNLGSGGDARIVIADDGSVSGSLVDTVWARAQGSARTGTLSGSLTVGVAQVTIVWSTGQSEKYEGVASAPSHGSLGINLRLYAPDGNFARSGNLAFALHEQGAAPTPPYGAPPTQAVDFLAQYVGQWTANFHSIDGNAGTGSVTITTDGELRGAVVDDAWSDAAVGNPERHGSLSGKVNAQGQLALAWTWQGGATQYVHGSGYFEAPETLVFQMGESLEAMKANGPSITLTLGRD